MASAGVRDELKFSIPETPGPGSTPLTGGYKEGICQLCFLRSQFTESQRPWARRS